jgi:anthranilate/para-aminobenzoate synthase component II
MIIILDFNDSFTWNIARFFYHHNEKTNVWAYPQRFLEMKKKINTYIQNGEKIVLVWGPGPGHPKEYPEYKKLLRWALFKTEIFNFGICLGHQMIGQEFHLQLKYLKTPMHGKKWSIKMRRPGYFSNLNLKKINVQSYNSMYLNYEPNKIGKNKFFTSILVIENRIESMKWKNGIAYQFHPESVGTSCPKMLFGPIFEFLYNSRDGLSD